MKQSMHAKRMARAAKRHGAASKLNLVSLMDIFTILVFFLLVNSSDVEVLQSDKSIKLPESVAEKPPENNLIVAVSHESILVGGRKVADMQQVKETKGNEIKGLKDELVYLAGRKPYKTEEEALKGRDVTIMGDKGIPYDVLKKVMTTCAKSEYRNISLAVSKLQEEVTVESLQAGEG
ncbi:ExbD/TolR family protein [Teredinibacter franksiae]|jgi:Biopolymer transport protein ExbD/TolR.|uniref:ExbD/TolR family protein n=1 Tax=Teredinibacter franksiae TaxID=2761453 RepID=UPI001629AE84|nr:biopolymer transporter ExbD [Teredinibacter franksiae]